MQHEKHNLWKQIRITRKINGNTKFENSATEMKLPLMGSSVDSKEPGGKISKCEDT